MQQNGEPPPQSMLPMRRAENTHPSGDRHLIVLSFESGTMIQKRIINERMKTSKHQNTAFHPSSLGLSSKNNPQ